MGKECQLTKYCEGRSDNRVHRCTCVRTNDCLKVAVSRTKRHLYGRISNTGRRLEGIYITGRTECNSTMFPRYRMFPLNVVKLSIHVYFILIPLPQYFFRLYEYQISYHIHVITERNILYMEGVNVFDTNIENMTIICASSRLSIFDV